ncbi:hypothetical protein FRB97_007634 [Tulasnella sp. 331]|nr:hypothetical protein FRB97_007634 [Tulasnella sp. 331]
MAVILELADINCSTPTMLMDVDVIQAPTPLQLPSLHLSSSEARLVSMGNGDRPIGTGDFCDMFHGIFIPTGSELAFKRPRFSSLEQVEAEALRTYLISPPMKPGNLSKFFTARMRYPALPEDEWLQSVIHGNEAANALLDHELVPLTCGFTLANTLDEPTPNDMEGAGSVSWMSPEPLEDQSKSHESDVYAFGMTISEGCEIYPNRN